MPDEIKYDGFPIKSPKMIEVFSEVADYAKQGYPLVLFGPSGSGKEFLAHHYFDKYMSRFREEGDFESFNCANLMDTTSVVELFGSAQGMFTGALNRPGLLEVLELGVLFLDEVGDLSPNVQPMLLRALHTNPRHRKIRRLGANKSDVIDPRLAIICATEKPVESIRQSLLYRMGAIIHVPGMEDRPEDVESAIPWLLNKAIEAIRNNLAVKDRLNSKVNAGFKDWSDFSVEVSRYLQPLVESRTWPGNFRSLNAAITQSVIRSAESKNYSEMQDNILRHFQSIRLNYSKQIHSVTDSLLKPSEKDALEKQEEIKNRMHEVVEIFPRIAPKEAVKIAEFLVNYSAVDFRRKDFEAFVELYKTSRTAQKRLRELVNHNLVTEKEKGIYCIAVAEQMNSDNEQSRPFTAPDVECTKQALHLFSKNILPLISKSNGIYISTKSGNRGKVSSCLAKLLHENNRVYYFSFGNRNMINLIEYLQAEILNANPYPGFEETLKKTTDINLRIPFLSGYLRVLFNESDAPVLILEHVDKLSRQERKELLPRLLDFWSCFRFVLLGDKMGNEFSNLTEYELDETL
jgi:transcriptional regulator with AAA-type ATPase domain